MENYSLPILGERLPQLKVKTTQGEMTLPDDYKGKWVVLFSHPADFTPVCTTEFFSFAKHQKDFEKLGVQLVGLSIDQVQSHLKWLEWIEEHLEMQVKFPVIADDRGKVAERLGMVHEAKGTNTVRAVFVIDPKGVVRAMLYYPQELGRNVEEILRMVKALQIADKHKVAMPANWPANELIGEKVIVSPASSASEKAKREQEKDKYDWWFVYTEVKE